jgi:DNA processing protein
MVILKHKLDGETGNRLKQLHDAPKQLFYKGVDPSVLLGRPSVAIVGARKMTAYGKAVTERLAAELARAGVVVISGLALGIDSTAQRAVVEAGGQTIAVLAHGLDTVQPAGHYGLAQQILQTGGSLVSEYEIGIGAQRFTFVARDRLIAGLADAVLVVEAAVKSGSLHTAGFALDLGKPVLAVPGPITSELSAGTNQLIKTGALTVTDATDIFMSLGITGKAVQQSFEGLTTQEALIIEALKSGVADGTQLQQAAQLDTSIFAQTITMLEIGGHIRSLGANRWMLA